jgi:hypothetical protein
VLASACNPSSLPGTPLGTYNVVGALGTNTCGAGLGAPSPWNFTVQLSEDSTTTPPTLYWLSSDGTEMYSTMSSATQVSITSTVTSNVGATGPTDAGPDVAASAGMEGACDLAQNTVLALTLAAGSPPTTFTGTMTYTFQTATGVSATSDCTAELATVGGPYNTLPCTASYSMTGTHQ